MIFSQHSYALMYAQVETSEDLKRLDPVQRKIGRNIFFLNIFDSLILLWEYYLYYNENIIFTYMRVFV